MKKKLFLFILLFVLSFSAIADDGTTHTGGKSCQPPDACRTAPKTGKEQSDNQIFSEIFDFLKSIFG
jgi:hypothetical protein